MDEVEAALDDVNLHRFLEVVKGLARDSQILVVTHQKRTMEVADALYGVSMRQEGASTVISQRLAGVPVHTPLRLLARGRARCISNGFRRAVLVGRAVLPSGRGLPPRDRRRPGG